ncbi:beta strand repeat-containing protein [Niabella sp. CJ426]|uniref:beta strand repeat-containing protein n=1 Tax=Niabella sp. CJ426 TaxID=3393740 RepID=UPI003CFD2358
MRYLFNAAFFVCLLFQSFASNATTFTVTNTGDNTGVDPVVGAGTGTLRQAIVDANANPGTDNIVFNIPGGGVKTISLSALLPVVTGSTVIDGYTQPTAVQGAIGARIITIAIDAGSFTGRDGLIRFASGANASSLSGFSIYNTGTSTEAVQIEPGCSDVHIWGNYIGILANGSSPAATTDYNGDDGVLIGSNTANSGTFSNITIGANGDGINDSNEGNVIANSADGTSGGDGIQLGTTSGNYTWTNIRVSGNYIGIAADGITAAPNGLPVAGTTQPNGQDGIFAIRVTNLLVGSDGNGTSDVFERNIISGNSGNGVDINNSGNVSIAGNYIGTDKTGRIAIPNGIKSTTANPFCGILVVGTGVSTSGIVIGFDDARHNALNAGSTKNIVSGNQGVGIQFYMVSGTSNKISGNYIGVDVTGNTALGNGRVNISHPSTVVHSAGIDMNATGNLLVGTNANGDEDIYEGNVISGNIDSRGVYIRNTSPSNVIAGNYIGVGADGITAVGNDFAGIHIDASQSNRIGSNDDGVNDATEANIIANNAKTVNTFSPSSDGIRITGNSIQNRISRNVFYSNKSTPIDLANDGVSLNDGIINGAQPNSLLDYPVITGYSLSGTTMNVQGYVSTCGGSETMPGATINGVKIIQFYKVADDGDQNAAVTNGACNRVTGHGEGMEYLGSITGVVNSFSASFILVPGASFSGSDKITAIAIDANGNTSEFGVTTVNNALSATFGDVTVLMINGQLRVNWTTIDENNNSHFDIEISTDGKSFTKAGQVKSLSLNGHSSTPLEYEFTTYLSRTSLGWGGGLVLLAGVSLGFIRRRKYLFTALVVACLALSNTGCSKDKNVGLNNENSFFVRIVQVDHDGTKTYSKVVRAILP